MAVVPATVSQPKAVSNGSGLHGKTVYVTGRPAVNTAPALVSGQVCRLLSIAIVIQMESSLGEGTLTLRAALSHVSPSDILS